VALLFKRTFLLGVGLLLVFVLAIAVSLWLIPKPHARLQYMVAGAVATALTLAAGFGVLNWLDRKRLGSAPLVRIRIARRSGQSS
jgi:hypothetical protein